MSTWAVLAAKPAAIATGFSAGLVPAIGTGSLDGFVIGAAMSGACFTALTAPGRARRRAATAATATGAGVAGDAAAAPSVEWRRYFLAAERFEPERGRQVPAADHAAGQGQGDSGPQNHPADRAGEDQGAGGYQSRHRVGDGSPIRRPRQEARRSAPKHAAPPASLTSRMTDMFAARGTVRWPSLASRLNGAG